MRRLSPQRALVQKVAEQAQREDGGGEGVARGLGVATERFGQEVSAVFPPGHNAERRGQPPLC